MFQDRFDSHRHRLKGVAQTDPRLNRALTHKGQIHGEPARRRLPNPCLFTGLTTPTHDRFTPGGKGQLEGHMMRGSAPNFLFALQCVR